MYARINVRTKPSGDSTFVRFAAKNEVLQVVNIVNGWAEFIAMVRTFCGLYQPKKRRTTPVTPTPVTPTPAPSLPATV